MSSAGPWAVRSTERNHDDLANMLLKITGTASWLRLGGRGEISPQKPGLYENQLLVKTVLQHRPTEETEGEATNTTRPQL